MPVVLRRYCFKRPQYFCMPLSQQPVFMHTDWRRPQLVMQIESVDRSGFFLQPVTHAVCSPLHRMGAAATAGGKSRARVARTAEVATIKRAAARESTGQFIATF